MEPAKPPARLSDVAAREAPPHAKELLERDIAATDRKIDELVYRHHGLTDKEIRIVEDGIGRGA